MNDRPRNDLCYFLPGLTAPIPSQLESRGLDVVFGRTPSGRIDCPPYAALDGSECQPTPTGGPGLLIGCAGVETPRFDPSDQTWIDCGPDAGFHIGFQTADPPGPEDLAREDQLPGDRIRLGDQRLWPIPNATLLPTRKRLAPGGVIESHVLPSCAPLMDMALEVWNNNDQVAQHPEMTSGELTQSELNARAAELGLASGDREREIIAAAIGANHRIGLTGVLALGLLDDRCEVEILRTLIDLDSMIKLRAAELHEASEKKKGEAE